MQGVANVGKAINGWRVEAASGIATLYNGNCLQRAAAAKVGIYGKARRRRCIH